SSAPPARVPTAGSATFGDVPIAISQVPCPPCPRAGEAASARARLPCRHDPGRGNRAEIGACCAMPASAPSGAARGVDAPSSNSRPEPVTGSHTPEPSSQAEVIEFLADPRTHGGVGPVKRFETHGNLVFLAGGDAWKIKRAVHFAYMDFSSL